MTDQLVATTTSPWLTALTRLHDKELKLYIRLSEILVMEEESPSEPWEGHTLLTFHLSAGSSIMGWVPTYSLE